MKIIKFTILLFCSSHLFGQSTNMWVLGYNGEVFYTIDSIKPARYSKISNNDILYIDKNAQLRLLKVGDKRCYDCLINESGTFNYNDLFSACINNKKSLGFEHWKYVYENLLVHEDEIAIESTVGGVYRAPGDAVMILPFDESYIVDSKIQFHWNRLSSCNKYYFLLSDEYHNNIITLEIFDTTFVLHDIASLLKKSGKYLWSILTENNESTQTENQSYIINLPDRNWQIKFNNDLALYKKDLVFEPEENEFLLGVFYEKYGVYPNAYDAYKSAVDLSNGESFYIKSFNSFYSNFTE